MGTLTSGHRLRVAAYHQLPLLPSWHPCHKPHGHDYDLEIELRAPRELVTDDVTRDLRVATGTLAGAHGPLHMQELGSLDGMDRLRSDSAALASWVHQWASDQLPDGLGDYLLVRVQAPAVERVAAVHHGPLAAESSTTDG
ncbi:6-carboxytetrahydropterin synthase [Streptomyces sp. NPDC059564]|uniref:6-carboxytetrahydropterin synthase n=1 Tax=Streptomyces sp. NPDC059564 TaxID=3346865 RepID=UPI0036BEF021